MIHTLHLYTKISIEEKNNIENRYNKSIEEVMKDINSTTDGISLSGRNRGYEYHIHVFSDVTKILNRGDIYDNDYDEVMSNINDTIENLVGYTLDMDLLRIDYRFDKYISSDSERKILMHMCKKMTEKSGFKVKKNKKEYKSSVRYDSKSMQLIVYDKEKERESTGNKCKDYEKKMLRLEVRLLNKHLNYNKRTYNIAKDLKLYFNATMKDIYMQKNMKNIIYKGDFYNIREADKIIDKSDLKEKDKTLIRDVLIDISTNSVTGAKELKDENGKYKYTPYKFKKAIDILESLNINPILIPKGKEYMDNERHYHIKNPFYS
jgi:hypothetical protein